MKIKLYVCAALLSVAAGAAFADTYPPVDASAPVSTTTRQEVIAELVQANAQGLTASNEANYPVIATSHAAGARSQAQFDVAANHSDKTPHSIYSGA